MNNCALKRSEMGKSANSEHLNAQVERPTQWPDGRKLGGENGYPPEWHAWARQCEVKFIARQMLAVPSEKRRAVHAQWEKKFPHATQEAVKAVWDEVVNEKRKGAA